MQNVLQHGGTDEDFCLSWVSVNLSRDAAFTSPGLRMFDLITGQFLKDLRL